MPKELLGKISPKPDLRRHYNIPEFRHFSSVLNDMVNLFPNQKFACPGIIDKYDLYSILPRLFLDVSWELEDYRRGIGFKFDEENRTVLEIAQQDDKLQFIVTDDGKLSVNYLVLNEVKGVFEESSDKTKQQSVDQFLKDERNIKNLAIDLTRVMSNTFSWIMQDQ